MAKFLPQKTTEKKPHTSIRSVLQKFFILNLILLASGSATWVFFTLTKKIYLGTPIMLFGLIAGLVFGITTGFRKRLSPYLTPVFAVLEGLFVGTYAYFSEIKFSLITLQAICMVFLIMGAMLLVYISRYISYPQKFRRTLEYAAFSIVGFYIVTMIMSLFFNIDVPIVFSRDWAGLTFSTAVLVVITLTFFVVYDSVDQMIKAHGSVFMEWYSGFLVLVTEIWLLIESFHLLQKVR